MSEIQHNDNKSRTFYPWEDLAEIGDTFITTNKHARQLVYAKNNSNKSKGVSQRYRAFKRGTQYVVERIADVD